MIFKKSIPRRTFLKGAGVSIALPLLDAMVPAMATSAETAEAASKVRLSIVYVPNGIIMDKWTPPTGELQLTPILEPLRPFRERLLLMSGLHHGMGRAQEGENLGDHARAGATYLTGVHPKKTEGADTRAGVSMDQIAARELGKHTQLASLELSVDPADLLGQCEAEYACAYMNTISWRTPTTPVPMEVRPRAVFERLFGDTDSTDPAVRLAQIQMDRSILDAVTRKANRLANSLGSGDRAKLSQYLDAVREVERRIQIAEEESAVQLPSLQRPVGVPGTFIDHAKLMFDLEVLAYQANLTRITTFMMGREFTARTYPEIGIPDGHHSLTHHRGDPDKIAKVAQINTYHAKALAYFLEKLQSTPDGDGSLLDHILILYGSSLSDGNNHSHENLPILLAGGGGGRIKVGRHVQYPNGTPMTNLLLGLLDVVGVQAQSLGDSNGRLEIRSV